MKYCCKRFEEIHDDLCSGSPFLHKDTDVRMLHNVKSTVNNKEMKSEWLIMCKIDMDSSGCDYEPIYYCPFCGARLKQ